MLLFSNVDQHGRSVHVFLLKTILIMFSNIWWLRKIFLQCVIIGWYLHWCSQFTLSFIIVYKNDLQEVILTTSQHTSHYHSLTQCLAVAHWWINLSVFRKSLLQVITCLLVLDIPGTLLPNLPHQCLQSSTGDGKLNHRIIEWVEK